MKEDAKPEGGFEKAKFKSRRVRMEKNTKINNKVQMFAQILTCIQASISDEYATRK